MARSTGTRVTRDYSKEEYREPGEGYTGEEPLKGIYPFRLVSVQEHTSQSDTESWHWIFEAEPDAVGKNGDEYAGWRGHLYTNDDSALWKEQQIMVALGIIRPNGKYSGTLEQIEAKGRKVRVMGRVIRERYIPDDGGEGEWRAKLTSVMKPKTDGGTARDDDEDETDEPTPPRSRSRRSAARSAPPEPEPDEVDDDEPEEDEPYDLDELQGELEALTLVALKKRAKEEFGFTASELRGVKAEDLVEQILDKVELDQDEEAEEDAEEEEPEEEPEPPKRSARARATTPARGASSSRTSARGRGARRGSTDDPPF